MQNIYSLFTSYIKDISVIRKRVHMKDLKMRGPYRTKWKASKCCCGGRFLFTKKPVDVNNDGERTFFQSLDAKKIVISLFLINK